MLLATWNTQGSNATALILNQAAQDFPRQYRNVVPDYICIQEAGHAAYAGAIGPPIPCGWNPAPSFGHYHEIGEFRLSRTAYVGYHIPWQATAMGNGRCSLAILWPAAAGPHAAMPLDGWQDGNAAHRPVFWVTPAAAGARRIACMHAPAGGNFGYITAAIGAVAAAAPAAGWVLAGDINMDPGALGALPAGVGRLDTMGATQRGGGNLDYLFYSGMAPFAGCASAGAYVESDHLQVRFV